MTEPNKPSWKQPVSRSQIISLLSIALIGGVSKMAGKHIVQAWQDAHPSITNPYPTSSALHEPFNLFSQKLIQLPEFKEQIKSVKSADEALASSMQLTRTGMRKLDNESLVRRAEIMGSILSKIDPNFCAEIVRGKVSDPKQLNTQIMNTLEQLDSTEIDDWLDLSFKAIERSLRDSSESTVIVDPEMIKIAMQTLIATLPSQEAEKLVQLLQSLNASTQEGSATNQDICWAGRTLYDKMLKLDPQYRDALARAFVQE